MIDFYNAFISYKHGPLDSKIAAHIQKNLEHFHVPHKLRKKIKHNKITRIFRDKDELPITSDLTETITDALAKAEYLVVICSTHTRESFWVRREINTFLKTHSQDKILTVLTEGEPGEVIPEELLSQVREYTDESGISHRVRVPVEPLSCDYRLRMSQADREELPRLASALLGCSYDELLRRRRQYRIRRAAAIVGVAFAAVAAFGFYMWYTGKKINDSYLNSLRSRSLYLANESEQLLSEGKRADALALALAALPDGPNDKVPVTASAVRAITDATASYRSNAGASFCPVWNYKTEHEISNGIISEDDLYIAMMDKSGNAYCWDTNTRELVFEKVGENDPVDIVFLGKEALMITYKDHIEAYNIQTGNLIWEFETSEDASIYKGDVVYSSRYVFLDIGKGEVAKLSAKDGSVKDTYNVKKDSFIKTIAALAVSEDGMKIAYADATFIYGDSKIHIYDTETGKDYAESLDSYLIEDISFAGDHLCVISSDDILFSSTSFSNELTYIQTATMKIDCFDSSMKPVWNSSLDFDDVAIRINTVYLPSREAVMFYIGNAAAIYDVKTGQELNRYNTGSSIVTADDYNRDGVPEFICRHGEYIFAIDEESNDLASYNVLCNNVTVGIISKYLYAVPSDSTDVICYYRYLQDDGWTAVDSYGGFTIGSSYQTSYVDGDTLIIAAKVSNTSDLRLSFIDMTEGELLFSTDIKDIEGLIYNFDIELVDDEMYGFFGYGIYLIDPEDGTAELINTITEPMTRLSCGKIITCDPENSELTVRITDTYDSDIEEISLSGIENIDYTDIKNPFFERSSNKVFIPAGKRLFAADLDESEIEEIKVPDTWNVTGILDLYVAVSDDGDRFLLSDGNTLLVTDGAFKEQYSVRCNSSYRINAVFAEDILYIVSDGYLILYDDNNGVLLNKYEMTLYGIGDCELKADDKNHLLFVKVGDQISIFDTESWIEIACVKNAYCYHEGTDRFYVYSFLTDSECTLGYIRHYSLDELIGKAKTLLGGEELPDEVKSKYGL